MFEKLQQMEQNYSILQEKLNQPETYDDPKTATRLNRELKELEEVVSTYRTWDACRQNCDELEGLLHSDDPELRSLAGEEFYGEKKRREALERQLQTLLIPKDPERHHRGACRSRRRGGRPIRPLPVSDVRNVRCETGVEAGADQRQ